MRQLLDPAEAEGMEEEGVKERGGRQREGGIASWLFDVDREYEKDPDKWTFKDDLTFTLTMS